MSLPIVEGVEFRAIEGYPGYAVGDDGSVWSCRLKGPISRFGEWRRMSPSRSRGGYLQLGFRRADGTNKKLTRKIHRLVLTTFIGPCPEGMEGCHENGIVSDNRLSNLRWDTPKGNAKDRENHGTVMRGERHSNAKLTDAAVKEIRTRVFAGERQQVLASQFGVKQSTVSNIAIRKIWKHVQ